MIDIIKEVRLIINFEGLNMRIGIHTVLILFLFLKILI
jgi:hypothetical protein